MRGTLQWKENGAAIGPLECDADAVAFAIKDCVYIALIFTASGNSIVIDMGYDADEVEDIIGLMQYNKSYDHDSLSDFEWDGENLESRDEWVNGEYHIRVWSNSVYDRLECVFGHVIMTKTEARRLMHEMMKSQDLLAAAGYIEPEDMDEAYTAEYEKLMNNLKKVAKIWRGYLYAR